jgi:hypothetical protein
MKRGESENHRADSIDFLDLRDLKAGPAVFFNPNYALELRDES